MQRYFKTTIISFVTLIILSCASPVVKPDINFTFMGRRTIGPAEDRYTFNYSLDRGSSNKMDIYVYEEKGNYLISPDFSKEQAISLYEYHSMQPGNNFFSRFRAASDYVGSLNEAIQKALLWYIDDFKIKGLINNISTGNKDK